MTPNQKPGPWDELYDDAAEFERLEGVEDLTSPRIHELLAGVKRLPAKERPAARRMLNPTLNRASPPRRMPDSKTSLGRAGRMLLLDRNRFLKEDVLDLRDWLGIPEKEVAINPGSQRWDLFLAGMDDEVRQERSKLSLEEQIARANGQLAVSWILTHRSAVAFNEAWREEWWPDDILDLAIDTATRGPGERPVPPAWIEVTKAPYPAYSAAPLDVGTHAMAIRHRLPKYALTALAHFVVSLDSSWIGGLPKLEVEPVRNTGATRSAYGVDLLIRGLDEHITETEWKLIWKAVIMPRKKLAFGQQYKRLDGRHGTDFERLMTYIDFYNDRRDRDEKFPEAIRRLRRAGVLDWDPETLRKAERDIDELLNPDYSPPGEDGEGRMD